MGWRKIRHRQYGKKAEKNDTDEHKKTCSYPYNQTGIFNLITNRKTTKFLPFEGTDYIKSQSEWKTDYCLNFSQKYF